MHLKQKIDYKFTILEKKRVQLFNKLEKFDITALNFNHQENKWSIIQIIHHLYKSEQLSIVYIKRSVNKSTGIDKSGITSAVRGLILEWSLRLPTKLKAPANVSNVPDFAELEFYKTKWESLRNELSGIIEKTNTEILMSDIFKHPSVGKMNIIHALKFMDAHFDHHKKQIDKILLINNKLV